MRSFRSRGYPLAVCLAAMAPPAAAQAPVPAALACTFHTASVSLYRDGTFKTEHGEETLAFMIAAINPAQQTAQLIGSVGASTAGLVVATGQMSFLEQTLAGNLTITTVFLPERGFTASAVHSRHMLMSGGPIVSQYVGTCDVKY